jgi:hypothetical protein
VTVAAPVLTPAGRLLFLAGEEVPTERSRELYIAGRPALPDAIVETTEQCVINKRERNPLNDQCPATSRASSRSTAKYVSEFTEPPYSNQMPNSRKHFESDNENCSKPCSTSPLTSISLRLYAAGSACSRQTLTASALAFCCWSFENYCSEYGNQGASNEYSHHARSG